MHFFTQSQQTEDNHRVIHMSPICQYVMVQRGLIDKILKETFPKLPTFTKQTHA